MNRFFKALVISTLVLAPIAFAGWVVTLVLGTHEAFPLGAQLAMDPRSPSSLSYALGRISEKESGRAPDALARQATPPAATMKIESLASSASSSGYAHRAFPSSVELLTDLHQLPPMEGARRAVQLLERLGQEDPHGALLLLGYLSERGPADPQLARLLLDQLSANRLELLPQDAAWRQSYVGLFHAALQRLSAPANLAGPGPRDWRLQAEMLANQEWRESFRGVFASEKRREE